MFKKEKNLLTAGIIVASILLLIYYVSDTTFTDSLSIAMLFSPLNIILFFIDPLTIVLVVALLICISFYRHFEEKERTAWRRAHQRNEDAHDKQTATSSPIEKPIPEITLDSDEYQKLFATSSAEITFARKHNETYAVEQAVRFRLEDDFGQFKNAVITDMRTQNDTTITVVVKIV